MLVTRWSLQAVTVVGSEPISASLSPTSTIALSLSVSLTPTVSPSPPELETVVNCQRMGAWGDVCRYSLTCWDGGSLFFFSNDGHHNHRDAPTFSEVGDMVRRRIGRIPPWITPFLLGVFRQACYQCVLIADGRRDLSQVSRPFRKG
jgi:hypothetical protein